jgi:hypothetical protein
VIDFNGKNTIAVSFDGSYGKNGRISRTATLSTWSGLFACAGLPHLPLFPIEKPTKTEQASLFFDEKTVKSKIGAKWTAPAQIVAWSSCRCQNYDFFVAATAGTVHILKSHLKNPSILPVAECNWDCAISTVTINSRLFAVAGIDNKIRVQQYSGDAYSFAFESALCISMALSENLLAAGFSNGTLIISSLHDKKAVATCRPFRIPVAFVRFVVDDRFLVRWGSAVAELSLNETRWIEVPKFEGALSAVFSQQGPLTLALTSTVDVYSFADEVLLARIPVKASAICANGRRTFILTIRKELVILHFHKSMRIEAQFPVNVDNPLGIVATSDTIYIICQQVIAVFDKTGKELDRIELKMRAKFYDSSSGAVYFVFGKVVWFYGSDRKLKQIAVNLGSITGFSAVDDTRFIVMGDGRIVLGDHGSEKNMFSALVKCEKRVVGLKAFASMIGGVVDSVLALHEDGSTKKWKLPSAKSK